jgi:hypothetical protein
MPAARRAGGHRRIGRLIGGIGLAAIAIAIGAGLLVLTRRRRAVLAPPTD